ncbi:hypothetical protein C1S82_20175 [Mycolicibacterium cosmeticum]|uniref:FHA domain-containing protein n=1 Tax=Mycolicibacterium cosmeticum TaxID=258533 RepID=W9AU57_MYCCO|nr:hypothetical protein [Mycolicibacterium cosmeticum]TLH71208.1 hypothetical protein C1S82_20175 [Mycolicibacterium cosmeticum]CDO06442.1 FHA domain-containing protein [Mycolicibacterium cosmeticum]
MKVKRSAPAPGADGRRRGNPEKKVKGGKRQPEPAARRRSPRRPAAEPRTHRPQRSAPQTSPIPRSTPAPTMAKSAKQAKARAKARKAKAPKIVRPPLRERLITRLAAIELSPRAMVARVPFVVLVIGALGIGLGMTLWLSTDAAERSYQLGHARELNQALLQQKEALERDVLEAQAAPALAEAARNLGMIPSRDTAHLVQDPTGNWMVVGTPKPAEGVPPPPLNTPLPDDNPAPAAANPAAAPAAQNPPAAPAPPGPRVVDPREVVVRVPAPSTTVAPAVPLAVPPAAVPVPGAPEAVAPVPVVAPIAPEAVPPAAVDGAPHLPAPLPAQPGPVGGVEQAAPVVPLGAPA